MNGYPPHFQDLQPPAHSYRGGYPPNEAYQQVYGGVGSSSHDAALSHPADVVQHHSPGPDSHDAAMLAFVNHSQSGGTSRSGSDPGTRVDEASGYATSNPPSATAPSFPPSAHRQLAPPAQYGARHRMTVGLRPVDAAANPDMVHQRALLLSFFEPPGDGADSASDPDPLHPTARWTNPYEQFDPNLIIDHLGNAALHWACSLSRLNLVAFLLSRGADPHRGNHSGETALVRCILATNVFDAQSLSELLLLNEGAIGGTLRTVDSQHRSILHHIALVAGVKGRAGVARYYMEAVLEYVARYEHSGRSTGEGFRTLVDVQDTSGDTALNIAARVGNRAIVRLLVDVGADRSLRNALGLRAEDFGIEEETLRVSAADDAIAAIKSAPAVPVQNSNEVIEDLKRAVDGLQTSFSSEMKAKGVVLSAAQAELLQATRDLAKERKRAQALESRMWDLDQVGQRIKNLQQALTEETSFDWTGRSAGPEAGPSFKPLQRLPSSAVPTPTFDGPDPVVDPKRCGDARQALIETRKIKQWQTRSQAALEQRIARVEQLSAEKEAMYKKAIALCSGVPAELVEETLDKLVLAIESDGSRIDLGRSDGRLQRARQQPA